MTETLHSDSTTAPPGPFVAVLRRGLLASLLANIPMLALLLVPQLMRSRAGSEALLFVGATLFVGLVVLGLMTAAPVCAWAAPHADAWTPGTANRTTRLLYRAEPRAFWQRLGEWVIFFVLSQAAGLSVAWLMPYVRENPDLLAAREARWLIQYDAYALHAGTIYLFSCFSFAWLGARLRQLALAAGDRRLRTPSISPACDV